jgi:hypothetical protein
MNILDKRLEGAKRRSARIPQTRLSKGLGPYKTYGPDNTDVAVSAGCAGCFGCAWLIYVCGFIAFWVIVALALIHYIHGH